MKVKEAKDVRWLSHQKAVATIVRTFPSLIASLQREASDRGNPTALGLFTLMTKFDFLCALVKLHDILRHLSKLSLVFQRKLVDLSMVSCFVNSTMTVINQRLTAEFSKKVYEDAEGLATRLKAATDIEVHIPVGAEDSFSSRVCRPFLVAVIDHLRNRFPAMELLEAFSIFNPHTLPASDVDELAAYGDDKLEVLLDHYSGTALELDREQAMAEWQMLRVILTENQRLQSLPDAVSFLCDPSTDGTLTQLQALSIRVLLLPVSTADCERGFSYMNRIVTPLRNRLKTENIDKLVRLSANGAEVHDFDFVKALSKWANLGPHRINV